MIWPNTNKLTRFPPLLSIHHLFKKNLISLLNYHGGGSLDIITSTLNIFISVMSMDPLDLLLLSSPLFHDNDMDKFTFWLSFLWSLVPSTRGKKFRKFWVYPRSNHYWEVTHTVVWQATTKMLDENYVAKYWIICVLLMCCVTCFNLTRKPKLQIGENQ